MKNTLQQIQCSEKGELVYCDPETLESAVLDNYVLLSVCDLGDVVSVKRLVKNVGLVNEEYALLHTAIRHMRDAGMSAEEILHTLETFARQACVGGERNA